MPAKESDDLDGLPRVGDVLVGKYRIEGVLGAGGMGAVLSATHLALGQRVAIKFMTGQSALDPAVVERFSREAWAAARIQNDHVARVSDVGTTPDGQPFLVMEHLTGEDLGGLVERGPLPVTTAVQFVLQAIEALAEAHSLGIIHRDLKPGNLFLTRRADGSPWIKVLDFGISKISGATKLTETSALMGSPLYMSPEQLNAAPLDARADIWGLGIILYELLTTEPPFTGETLPQICTMILHGEPRRLTRRDVPMGLVQVIERCIQKSPSARFDNLAHLAVALAPYGGDEAQASVRFTCNVFGRASLAEMPTLLTEVPPGSLDNPDLIKTTPVRLSKEAMLSEESSDARVRVVHARPGSSTEMPVSANRPPRRHGLVGLIVGLAVSFLGAITVFILVMDTGDDGVSADQPVTFTGTTAPEAAGRADGPEVAPAGSAAPDPAPTASTMPVASASASPSTSAAPPKKVIKKTPPSPPATPPPAGGTGKKKKWSPFDDR